nr:hypothetical protein [Tanacetum cinerariifolium]
MAILTKGFQHYSIPINNNPRTSLNTRLRIVDQSHPSDTPRRQMTTGTIGNAEYVWNTRNSANGMNNARVKDVGNNGKRKGNSKFFKEVILIAKKEESRINLTDNEYDFLFAASIEEPENQELEASGIFMETISEIKSETKNQKSPTYDKEDGAEQQSNVVDFDFF